MSREIAEWVGKNDDTAIPPRVQWRVFQKYSGICPKCERPLQPGKWACDHIKALINGGENRESNLQPLCVSPCHSQKTRKDVAEKAMVYRKASKHVGVKKRRRTIAGRRFDGTPIPPKWVDG